MVYPSFSLQAEPFHPHIEGVFEGLELYRLCLFDRLRNLKYLHSRFTFTYIPILTILIAIGRPPSNNPPNVNGVSPSFAAPKWSPASLLQPRGFPQAPQAAQNNMPNSAPPQRLMFQFDSPQGSSQSSTPDSASLQNSNPRPAGFEQYANGNGPVGMGNMLERMHNVASRDMMPQKRRKIHDGRAQNDQKKAEFNGGGKGGVIGEYMREKKEQGQKESLPTRTAVDISASELL
jgi:hypothetical protein